MKDNFSISPDHYAKYRPAYPQAFFDYLETIVPARHIAWDCGTGNGQVARELARFFQRVYASDISQAQLSQATQLPNIEYSVQPAEKTNFPDRFFDLIVVAQAIHWFDFDAFYREARRVAKPGALLVVIGYGRLHVDPTVDAVIDDFYTNVIGPYWDPERRYIDENYATIPFPAGEIEVPPFGNRYSWTLDHLTGYLGTWSAVKHYMAKNGSDPLQQVGPRLKEAWGQAEKRTVEFPLLLRIARLTE